MIGINQWPRDRISFRQPIPHKTGYSILEEVLLLNTTTPGDYSSHEIVWAIKYGLDVEFRHKNAVAMHYYSTNLQKL